MKKYKKCNEIAKYQQTHKYEISKFSFVVQKRSRARAHKNSLVLAVVTTSKVVEVMDAYNTTQKQKQKPLCVLSLKFAFSPF